MMKVHYMYNHFHQGVELHYPGGSLVVKADVKIMALPEHPSLRRRLGCIRRAVPVLLRGDGVVAQVVVDEMADRERRTGRNAFRRAG